MTQKYGRHIWACDTNLVKYNAWYDSADLMLLVKTAKLKGGDSLSYEF